MSDITISNLITKIKQVENNYINFNKYNSENYNVFEVLGVLYDEVKLCKIIADLLNPNGSHGQGDLFLALFFKEVLNIEYDKKENYSVKTEYVIQNYRRIDIVIISIKSVIPIEVKINACDQENQIFDYFKSDNRIKNIYYLTKYGNDPTFFSIGGLDKRKVIDISFCTDIINWLTKSLESLQSKEVIFIVKQIIYGLEKITGRKPITKMDEEIIKELENKDNFKVAVDISKNMYIVREKLMYKFFNKIESLLENDGVKCLKSDDNKIIDDYKFNDFQGIKNYNHKNTWPSINYYFGRSKENPELEIWIRLEIADVLFIGYCTPEFNESTKTYVNAWKTLSDNECINLLGKNHKGDTWWAYKELITDSNNRTINFRTYNDGFCNLLDEKYFNDLVQLCVSRIKELLNYNKMI